MAKLKVSFDTLGIAIAVSHAMQGDKTQFQINYYKDSNATSYILYEPLLFKEAFIEMKKNLPDLSFHLTISNSNAENMHAKYIYITITNDEFQLLLFTKDEEHSLFNKDLRCNELEITRLEKRPINKNANTQAAKNTQSKTHSPPETQGDEFFLTRKRCSIL